MLGLMDRITIQQMNLLADWSIENVRSINSIINIDWPELSIVDQSAHLLPQNGTLLVETFSNRGENWRSLPKAGTYRKLMRQEFVENFYKEVRAGPIATDAVTVKAIGIKM